MNATQIIAVQILKIEGIYTLESGKIVQGKKGGRGGDGEMGGFLILERGDVRTTEKRREVDGC